MNKNNASFVVPVSGSLLVNFVIIAVIIGTLSLLVLPGISKAIRQSWGRRAIQEARMMDRATDEWAKAKGKPFGSCIVTSEAAAYLKAGEVWPRTDPCGNEYEIGAVGASQIQITIATKKKVGNNVGIDWGQY